MLHMSINLLVNYMDLCNKMISWIISFLKATVNNNNIHVLCATSLLNLVNVGNVCYRTSQEKKKQRKNKKH